MEACYVYGNPLAPYAVVKGPEEMPGVVRDEITGFSMEELGTGLRFRIALTEKMAVYGLGETMRGINKRGHHYMSYNTDDPHHHQDMPALYGTHNFLVLDPVEKGEAVRGLFFDSPAKATFDVGEAKADELCVVVESKDLRVYVLVGRTAEEVTKTFLGMIGRSFLPPLWGFGFSQSRWGYKNADDIREVVNGYRNAGIPLDSVCMDIDYMDRYIDFTVNKKRFPKLPHFVEEMRNRGIHLVPIIDAGVKVEKGNPVYEEGVANGYFCLNKDGKPFKAAVWPGMTHFPDFFQPEARKWFGSKYKVLTDAGIEGFWNDMNEPAVFYSEVSPKTGPLQFLVDFFNPKAAEERASKESAAYTSYHHFYHKIDGKMVLHHDVHNMFGALMTTADGEGLEELLDHRYLLYSRASYIGAHRYGGIWTGDNNSSFEMLKVNVCQMASLNMCGFLYSGADTGGFGGNCNRELLLRWLAFSDFTPLMRDHSAMATKNQECYQFGDTKAFAGIVGLRYLLLPYIYSEFMKAALRQDMYMKPIFFAYPEDEEARSVEDQLIVGESIMIAPVIEGGVTGRKVYLPEEMTQVRYRNGKFSCEPAKAGWREVQIPLDEVVFYILPGKAFIHANKMVMSSDQLDLYDVTAVGEGAYEQYVDDGRTKDCSLDRIRVVEV